MKEESISSEAHDILEGPPRPAGERFPRWSLAIGRGQKKKKKQRTGSTPVPMQPDNTYGSASVLLVRGLVGPSGLVCGLWLVGALACPGVPEVVPAVFWQSRRLRSIV